MNAETWKGPVKCTSTSGEKHWGPTWDGNAKTCWCGAPFIPYDRRAPDLALAQMRSALERIAEGAEKIANCDDYKQAERNTWAVCAAQCRLALAASPDVPEDRRHSMPDGPEYGNDGPRLDDDAERCEECGAFLDEDGVCEKCGWYDFKRGNAVWEKGG